MKLEKLMEVIQQYKDQAKLIQEFVPSPNPDEIYLIAGLKTFLKCTDERSAFNAIQTGNSEFQRAIGYKPSPLPGVIDQQCCQCSRKTKIMARRIVGTNA